MPVIPHIEISQLICTANQYWFRYIGFHTRATLALNGLNGLRVDTWQSFSGLRFSEKIFSQDILTSTLLYYQCTGLLPRRKFPLEINNFYSIITIYIQLFHSYHAVILETLFNFRFISILCATKMRIHFYNQLESFRPVKDWRLVMFRKRNCWKGLATALLKWIWRTKTWWFYSTYETNMKNTTKSDTLIEQWPEEVY